MCPVLESLPSPPSVSTFHLKWISLLPTQLYCRTIFAFPMLSASGQHLPKTKDQKEIHSLLVSEHLFFFVCLLSSYSLWGDALHGAQMTDSQWSQWKVNSVNPALWTHFPGSLWKLTTHKQPSPASWLVFYFRSMLLPFHIRTTYTKIAAPFPTNQIEDHLSSESGHGGWDPKSSLPWIGPPRII